MKTLLFDIETAPNLSYVWELFETDVISVKTHWYMISFAYKWLGEKKIHAYSLPDFKSYKKNREDDRELCRKLWELFNEADIVCVEENTPVLKQDLTWVPAGSLKVGEKIVGFDEGKEPEETLRDSDDKWKTNCKYNQTRYIKPSTVTGNYIKNTECYEVKLSNGESIITTPNHYWLARTKKDNYYKWIKTEDMNTDIRITKFWNVWESDKSYDAGWLSGFISGEGTLKQSGKSFSVDFYQRPGSTWNQAIESCKKLNMPISKERTQRATGIGRQDTLATGFLGGKFKIAEYIGRLGIKRFIEKIKWERFGGLKTQRPEVIKVISVKPIGKRNVAVLETSTKTFFARGYPMHNCAHNGQAFDVKKSQGKFLQHGFPPPQPFKQVDTLRVARKYFKFDSNKLDALGKYLGIGEKLVHTGWKLWEGCIKGDDKSWKTMIKYNKQDVHLLEQVYLKMRPWIDNHPNSNLYNGTMDKCPNCGGETTKQGLKYNRTTTMQQFKCKDCFAWSSRPLKGIIR